MVVPEISDTAKRIFEVLDVKRSLIVFILTLVLFVALALFLINDPACIPSGLTCFRNDSTTPSLWDEDSLFEYLTSGFATIAGILWLSAIRRAKSRGILLRRRDYILTLLFALMMMFLAGEEISWGQRILNIETPEFYKEINMKNEINLHNLYRRFSRVLYIATLAWSVLLPVLQISSRYVHRSAWTLRCPVAPIFLASLFLSAPLFRILFYSTYGSSAREGMELIFAIAFLAVALHANLKPDEIWVRPADDAAWHGQGGLGSSRF